MTVGPTTLAYCAGLFDGEGCITIKRSNALTHRRKSPTYVLSLCIEMADPRPIQAFCAAFGLQMHRNDSRHLRNPARHRPLFVAQIGKVAGVRILKRLLPYLRGKREEALLAIEFYEHAMLAHHHNAVGFNRRPLPIAVLEQRHAYYLKLRAAKARQFRPSGEPVDSPA